MGGADQIERGLGRLSASLAPGRAAAQSDGTVETANVLIAGGGLPGLALAIALRRALGPSFAVTVADPALAAASPEDPRASAIAAAARRFLEALGVWDALADQAQPILDMVITDSRVSDRVRPALLTFAGEIAPGEPFAHMIENGPLIATLLREARACGVALRAAAVAEFEEGPAHVAATLNDGGVVRAALLVAADGARSRLREMAGIRTVGWRYGQSAIAATVEHERPHGGQAREHFLPSGPFATLPLRGNRASIVWTEDSAAAEHFIALPDNAFCDELERRFGLEFGDLRVVGPRRAFPLGFQVARRFVAGRVALAGDAAHFIHPIAGQGLNVGLRDVAALAEAIVDAARLGLDPGEGETLRRYERWRRFDTATMGFATDVLNRLFSNESDILRVARDFGLGVVDRLPSLKELFIREAAGLTGTVPKLLRGEAL